MKENWGVFNQTSSILLNLLFEFNVLKSSYRNFCLATIVTFRFRRFQQIAEIMARKFCLVALCERKDNRESLEETNFLIKGINVKASIAVRIITCQNNAGAICNNGK